MNSDTEVLTSLSNCIDNYFNAIIIILIVSNALFQGMQVELSASSYPDLFRFFDVYDDLTVWFVRVPLHSSIFILALRYIFLRLATQVLVFMFEIILRWLDSFVHYWENGWNVFDFIVTVMVHNLQFRIFAMHEKTFVVNVQKTIFLLP